MARLVGDVTRCCEPSMLRTRDSARARFSSPMNSVRSNGLLATSRSQSAGRVETTFSARLKPYSNPIGIIHPLEKPAANVARSR